MRGQGKFWRRRVAWGAAHRAIVCAVTTAMTAALLPAPAGGQAPGPGDAAWTQTASQGQQVTSVAPPPPRLWIDGGGNWVHQKAAQFNVYVAARNPRVRFWVGRYARAWSRATVVQYRLVPDPAAANVVVYEGHYGRRALVGWTGVCSRCSITAVYFNLDQLRSPGLRYPARLGAVTCQELGHVAGLWHGGGDCMSFGYHRVRTYGIGAGNARLVNLAYRQGPRGLRRRLAAGG